MTMTADRIIDPTRIRTSSEGTFAFIPHRFLRQRFWQGCDPRQLVVYFFLVLVADRHGVSFYSREKAAALCRLSPDTLQGVCEGLASKDLIAQEGSLVQVLSLPMAPAPQEPAKDIRPTAHESWSVAEALHAFRLDLERRNR